MPGDIENSIFENITSATGDDFSSGDVPATDQGTVVDREQQQIDTQAQEREAVPQPKEQTPDPKAKPKEQEKPPADAQDRKDHDRFHGTKRLEATANRLRSVNQNLTQVNEGLVRQLAEARVLNGLPQQFGLNGEEVAGGLDFIALMKTSPAKAAKQAIEIAISRGAQLRDIVNDEFIPNVGIQATQRLLDERLGPVQRNQQTNQAVANQQQEVVTKANQFLADYPEADLHSDVVAEQIRRIMAHYNDRGIRIDPYVAAEQAWHSVSAFAQREGLDIRQPLGPQMAAKQGRPQTPTTKPMPNGGGNPQSVRPKVNQADPSDNFKSITRQAMIEAGYQFDH